MNQRIPNVRELLLAAVLTALAGCSESPDALLKSAKDYQAKGDQNAAVIQLRSAVQKNPSLPEARFMLGVALFDTGELAASEKELRKAIDVGYPADEVVPTLVRVMVEQGHYKEALAEFGGAVISAPQGAAELKSALGRAFVATGEADLAKVAYAAALTANPDYPPALVGMARQTAASGDIAGALASTEAVLAKNPKFAEGWVFKGELAAKQGQPDEALAAYRKAVELRPDFIAVHAQIVTLLLKQEKIDEAAAQFDAVTKIAPNHPTTLYLQGMLAYGRKDYPAARDALQKQLRAQPRDLQGLLLSGVVDYELKSYATAELKIAKFLNAVPNDLYARRMLVATYIDSGQPAKALGALKPALGAVEKDPTLAALAGEVYLRNGQTAEAAKYFDKTVAIDPKSSEGRVGRAVSRLAAGETRGAYDDLENAAAESSATNADLVLIRSALYRREFDRALSAIAALEKKQPKSPVAPHLRGVALLGKRDAPGARKSFEQALALDPVYFPSTANLARLDLADKKPELASKRFDAILAKDPNHLNALLAIAELRGLSGGSPDEVTTLINKAIVANRTAPSARLALISHLLRTKDFKKAIAAAQEALAALPDHPEILRALGQAQLAAGDTNQAIASFNKVVQLEPDSPLALLLLAEAQAAAKDREAALQTLRRALAMKSDLIEAQRAMFTLELAAGRTQQAMAIARAVQKQRPNEPIGYLLEGDVSASTGSWTPAAAAYRSALKRDGWAEAAVKLHEVLVSAGNASEAEKVATTWIKENPQDRAFRLYLAQTAFAKNDYATAAKWYRVLVEAEPESATLLNNLAWSAGRIQDPRALEYAEKANKLAPDQPATLNTLGMLLVEKGDRVRGTELLQRASKLAPSSASIRLNLAKALLLNGQKDAAKVELAELAKLGDKFQAHAEVAQLMKGL